MTDEIKILQDLLHKYQVTRPVPAGVRGEVLARKRKNFVAVMKKLDRYNPLLGAFLFIYFLFRKFGIIATLKQCGVVLAVSAALTLAGLSAGTYVLIKHVLEKTHSPVEMQKDNDGSIKDDTIHKSMDKSPKQSIDRVDSSLTLSEVKNIIAFQPFEGMNASTGEASLVSGLMQNELIRIRGSKNIISARTLEPGASARLLLIGTVRKIGVSYAITAKVIDRESGKIHFTSTQDARADTLSIVSKKLAKEISDTIE
jgi:hypothetical protein